MKKHKVLAVVLLALAMTATTALSYDLNTKQSAKLAIQRWYTLTTGHNMQQTTLNEIADYVFSTAQMYDIEPKMVLGIMAIESSFIPTATNGISKGLMQVQPDTAKFVQRYYGVISGDLYIIPLDILYGIEYLAYLKHLGLSEEGMVRSYNGASAEKTLSYYKRYLSAVSRMESWR
jgi:soluble lytic murein transglycosylase-like protein